MECEKSKKMPGVELFSIVIPVFNELKYTRECLDSLFKYTSSEKYELIIIDNGSKDGTGKYLATLFIPNKKIITNSRNMGVAYAWNQGIRASTGEYIAIVNNDINFTPNWLENFEEAFQKYPEIGVLFPQTVERIRPANFDVIAEEVSRGPCVVKLINDPFPNPKGCVGWFMVYRREVFKMAGTFDENFEMYWYEDTDMFHRLMDSKIPCGQLQNVVVFHYGARTLKRQWGRWRYIKKNALRFEEKWKK